MFVDRIMCSKKSLTSGMEVFTATLFSHSNSAHIFRNCKQHAHRSGPIRVTLTTNCAAPVQTKKHSGRVTAQPATYPSVLPRAGPACVPVLAAAAASPERAHALVRARACAYAETCTSEQEAGAM